MNINNININTNSKIKIKSNDTTNNIPTTNKIDCIMDVAKTIF